MGDDLPFFKFYVADWLSDMNVRAMGPACRGIYVDLLALDWKEDGIPDDPDFLARTIGVDADRMRDAWETLADRFQPHEDKDGWVTNRRLSRERREIRASREKRSQAARKAAEARWSKQDKGDGDATASESHSDSTIRASDSGSNSGSGSLPEEGEEREKGEEAQRWMHEVWHDELGIEGHRIKLTNKRRQKYRAMYAEHLADLDDPPLAWRVVLRCVQHSDHHMSRRSYQMPESLLRNEDRRERWVQETLQMLRNGGSSDADRKAKRRREKLAREIERRRTA